MHDLTLAEASARIEAGELSPITLTEAVIDRITATEPLLHSYVTLMIDSARADAHAAAERARAGRRRGPLDGIPVAIKDLFDTAGVVTTGGTGAYRDRVPDRDATAVARLRAAGAVILGKTNTHELAYGGSTNNPHYGATHNPWDLTRVPGGSSGGSGSAVAAGQALAALGTDTGGSIRIPAAFCGITGHKPTYGLVGRTGILPLAPTLDHAGPLGRTAWDCALVLNALQGYDPADLDSVDRPPADFTAGLDRDVAGTRVAIVPSLLADVEPDVAAAFEASLDVLRGLGVIVEQVEPMGPDLDWLLAAGEITGVEAYESTEHLMSRDDPQIGPVVHRRIKLGGALPAWYYARQLRERLRIAQAFDQTLVDKRLTAYVLPTAPLTAFPTDPDPLRDEAPHTTFLITSVFNLTHQPSVSVPNGFAAGLPTGLMISTGRWHDADALWLGHAFQQVTDFHTRRPPV